MLFAVEGVELSKEARALGFPIEHKHKLACLRQELIDAFVEARYIEFIKQAALNLQQLGATKKLQKDSAKVRANFGTEEIFYYEPCTRNFLLMS